MKKNKNFIIKYYFDGTGNVEIKAKDEAEAREKWLQGNFCNEEEFGENYTIADIKEAK